MKKPGTNQTKRDCKLYAVLVVCFLFLTPFTSDAQSNIGALCSVEYDSIPLTSQDRIPLNYPWIVGKNDSISIKSQYKIKAAVDSLIKNHTLYNLSIPLYGYSEDSRIAMFFVGTDTLVCEFDVKEMFVGIYALSVTKYAKYGQKLETCLELTSKEAKYFRTNFKLKVVPELDKYVGRKSSWKSYHQGKLGEAALKFLLDPLLLIALAISFI